MSNETFTINQTLTIPTLTLGEYLYTSPQNFRNTVARFRDDTIRKRPFNPSITLPSRYIMDSHGRTQPNPGFRVAYQARMGFYEDEVSGSLTGERLATGNIGELDEGILKFCAARGIPLSPVVAVGAAALQEDLSPFEVARLDALYVAKGFGTAWDLLIAPASTPGTGSGPVVAPVAPVGSPATPTTPAPSPITPTPPVTPSPAPTSPLDPGLPFPGTSPVLDPTSAVIADLRRELEDAQQQLTEVTVASRTRDKELQKILSRKEFIPPERGGGQPTIKWRNFYNAISALIEPK